MLINKNVIFQDFVMPALSVTLKNVLCCDLFSFSEEIVKFVPNFESRNLYS